MQYLKLMILQKITFYTFRSIIREQLLTRHLVDTTTALVPHHCLVGSVEIRRAKDFHPLDNARAEHNKTPNRHNHRLGADNNGVMTLPLHYQILIIKSSSLIQLKNEIVLTFVV